MNKRKGPEPSKRSGPGQGLVKKAPPPEYARRIAEPNRLSGSSPAGGAGASYQRHAFGVTRLRV